MSRPSDPAGVSRPSGSAGASPTAGFRPLPGGLLALGLLLFGVAGLLAGLIEVTLIPLRYGTTLVPVAPVLAVLTGVMLPALGRGLTDSTLGAAPPAILQLLAIWLLATGRPEGDVLMPAGSTAWVSYSVLVLGTLVPLGMLGFTSRPGRWNWPLDGWRGPAGRRRSRFARRPAPGRPSEQGLPSEPGPSEQAPPSEPVPSEPALPSDSAGPRVAGRRRPGGRRVSRHRARPDSDSDGDR